MRYLIGNLPDFGEWVTHTHAPTPPSLPKSSPAWQMAVGVSCRWHRWWWWVSDHQCHVCHALKISSRQSIYSEINKYTYLQQKTSLDRSLAGPTFFKMAMDRRPDRGYGLLRSSKFAVFSGPGPVWSRSFSGPVTGLPNTRHRCLGGTVARYFFDICGVQAVSQAGLVIVAHA